MCQVISVSTVLAVGMSEQLPQAEPQDDKEPPKIRETAGKKLALLREYYGKDYPIIARKSSMSISEFEKKHNLSHGTLPGPHARCFGVSVCGVRFWGKLFVKTPVSELRERERPLVGQILGQRK